MRIYTLICMLSMQWSPVGLSRELLPIAYIESSNGKNVNHAKNANGPWWTAVGALGLKPSTAYDRYLGSKELQERYQFTSKDEFIAAMKSDIVFYNALCNLHWIWLKRNLPTKIQAVYAWKWGRTAAITADMEVVSTDTYVVAYTRYTNK